MAIRKRVGMNPRTRISIAVMPEVFMLAMKPTMRANPIMPTIVEMIKNVTTLTGDQRISG
jgi:hypothetical protein